jgi:hypothetical protein
LLEFSLSPGTYLSTFGVYLDGRLRCDDTAVLLRPDISYAFTVKAIHESGEQRIKWKREMAGHLAVQRELHGFLVFDLELKDATYFHTL